MRRWLNCCLNIFSSVDIPRKKIDFKLTKLIIWNIGLLGSLSLTLIFIVGCLVCLGYEWIKFIIINYMLFFLLVFSAFLSSLKMKSLKCYLPVSSKTVVQNVLGQSLLNLIWNSYKSLVNFSVRLLHGRVSARLSVRLSFTFSHFYLLLKKHRAIFN